MFGSTELDELDFRSNSIHVKHVVPYIYTYTRCLLDFCYQTYTLFYFGYMEPETSTDTVREVSPHPAVFFFQRQSTNQPLRPKTPKIFQTECYSVVVSGGMKWRLRYQQKR